LIDRLHVPSWRKERFSFLARTFLQFAALFPFEGSEDKNSLNQNKTS
jgi:hypothetical protein